MNTEGKWNEPGSPAGEPGDIEAEARGVAHKARSRMRSLADTGREELADQLGGLGRALHSAGGTLRDEEQGQAGHYGELIGDQLERASRYLREHDAGAMIGQIEGFARRQPLLFLGGCVAVGLAVGRFLKAGPGGEETPTGVTGEVRSPYEPPSVETVSPPLEGTGAAPTAPVGGRGGELGGPGEVGGLGEPPLGVTGPREGGER